MNKSLMVVGGVVILGGAAFFAINAIREPDASEFIDDSDAVYDLFQDDFGTGAQYDDRAGEAEMTAEQFIDAADDTSASEQYERNTAGLVDLETRFEHVVPGKYSEIYTRVSGVPPGTRIVGHLSGGNADIEDAAVTGTAGDDGVVLLTWRITSYGTYNIIINDTKNTVFEKDQVVVN